MTNQLAKTESQLMSFTDDQVDLIKKLIAPGTTADELQLFLYVSKKRGLDPLTRQIYCQKRRQRDPKDRTKWIDKMTIITGIDGFRAIAERTGNYGGQDEPEFGYKTDGNGKDVLQYARIKVYKFRGNLRYLAAVGVAFWDEYVVEGDEYIDGQKTSKQVPTGMWKKMPHNQLAKVAEALGLRKAFPEVLGGIYTNVEMEQDRDEDLQTVKIEVTKSADEYRDEFISMLQEYEGLLIEAKEKDAYGWATRNHPDNWKNEQTAENFVLAIDALHQRINTLKIKLNKS